MIPVPSKRVADFENMGFGMFIHYGLYALLERGEWIMEMDKIPADEYTKLAERFTAKDFDAEKIVNIAKSAGMKYITLTTRHHDGFSLYDTKGLSDFDAPHYIGRDLIREFVDACNAGGIVPFFYHTTLDWRVPSFKNDFKAYLQYLNDSVEVLCTEYGKIGGLWFDGNWSRPKSDWDEDSLYAVIRKHQPEAMIINNSGLGALGEIGNPEIDSVTFEQGRPTPMNRENMSKYVSAEMCDTFGIHWGHAKNDFNSKSLGQLIETLCHCRKVGANYLLNVGPDGDGNIVPLQRIMLEEVGRWISICGKNSIYEGRPSEIKGERKNFVLDCNSRSYLYIHKCGIGQAGENITDGEGPGYRHFINVKKKVRNISWNDNGEDLRFIQDGEDLWVYVTAQPYGTDYVVRVAEVIYED